jgi:hypothetical protein
MGGASSIWENISCVGHYWLRGEILAAWGNIGCVGYGQLTVHAGRNIPEKLRSAIESEMDLESLERQIVARFHYESAVSKAFHALREYDDEKAVIAYARKILGLDQHDDRSESPQIEADMGPPPIGTPH